MRVTDRERPLAIAMWDFSWLERRYPGGGFEDWDRALDELVERGYDAVRIDVYPHLLSADPDRKWLLRTNPMMEGNEWGAPGIVHVRVRPSLVEFLEKCAERDVSVGLSTWFREDLDDTRMDVETPADLVDIWADTLTEIERAGLTDSILYVDLCNEFPAWIRGGDLWSDLADDTDRFDRWLSESIERVRSAFPDHDYSFSFTGHEAVLDRDVDVSAFDFLNLHIWMIQGSDFRERVEAESDFDSHYDALADAGEAVYRADERRWQRALDDRIDWAVEWSRDEGLPIVTTESWGVVHARDWPRLEWDWIKELCAYGVREAVDSGRWVAISTSNFCEPQYESMWRDADWHREQTEYVRQGTVDVGR